MNTFQTGHLLPSLESTLPIGDVICFVCLFACLFQGQESSLSLTASFFLIVVQFWTCEPSWASVPQVPEGCRTDSTCWLLCCARVQEEVQEGAATVEVVEPNFLSASPDSPAPASATGCRAGTPGVAAWAQKAQTFLPRTQAILCSWSVTCASLLMCSCSWKTFSTPKVFYQHVSRDL